MLNVKISLFFNKKVFFSVTWSFQIVLCFDLTLYLRGNGKILKVNNELIEDEERIE